MFKKLRNKFLVLNLVTISVMILISFTTIYLITYKNIHSGIDMELHKISEFNSRMNDTSRQPKVDFNNSFFPQQRSVSFNLITNSNYVIQSSVSIFSMDPEFYEKVKDIALSKHSKNGQFKLYGTYWSFIINPHNAGYKITFLDTTSQHDILANLIYTFFVVALFMLFLIFFISKFFANKSIAPIKESFDKQKQFIADASHELKTPLAVISTNVDVLLANHGDLIQEQSKWLYYIKSEVERMSKLTNDLLYLTQMDYSDAKTIFSNFNISEAVESVILTMEAVIFENFISLNYSIDPDLIVYGSMEQIKQVAMILLDNALKYTNPKGNVTISLKKHNNNMILFISNTGNGIPSENIPKIFDRFYRVDKSRSRDSGGYGLGLAIAKAIVDQHNGKISVSSIVNKVTTFTVELPLSSNSI